MTIEGYIHRIPHGRGLRVSEDGWYTVRFGILNGSDRGDLDGEVLEELEEDARELDYNGSLDLKKTFLGRFYGGSIETPYGRREWVGEMPGDVEEFVDEIQRAISDGR